MKKIVLIGSGNVATNLGVALKEKGYNILQVWSQNLENAKRLAEKTNSSYTSNTKELLPAELYIISIKDDAIHKILEKLPNIPVIHTSGATSINIFKNKFSKHGVIYPVQKFTKKININLQETPILVEANNETFKKDLMYIASKLSKHVISVDSEKRKQLHIAAVFASNFSNYMYTIAESILKNSNIDFKLLLPLIKETANNLDNNLPSELQTGPAKRNDIKIIEMHLESIKNDKIKNIYNLISNAIILENE